MILVVMGWRFSCFCVCVLRFTFFCIVFFFSTTTIIAVYTGGRHKRTLALALASGLVIIYIEGGGVPIAVWLAGWLAGR